MTQMLTSVQQTTEVVALKPTATTLWAASLVPVDQDTLGTDLPAQVIKTSCKVVPASHASQYITVVLNKGHDRYV